MLSDFRATAPQCKTEPHDATHARLSNGRELLSPTLFLFLSSSLYDISLHLSRQDRYPPWILRATLTRTRSKQSVLVPDRLCCHAPDTVGPTPFFNCARMCGHTSHFLSVQQLTTAHLSVATLRTERLWVVCVSSRALLHSLTFAPLRRHSRARTNVMCVCIHKQLAL